MIESIKDAEDALEGWVGRWAEGNSRMPETEVGEGWILSETAA